MLRTLTSFTVGAFLAFGAGTIIAPDTTANILHHVEDTIVQVTTIDCDARPVDCLESKEADLVKTKDQIDKALKGLTSQEERAAMLLQEQQEILSKNKIFANEGRRLHNGNAQSVEFVGRTYMREELAGQLEILFMEQNRLQEVVAESKTTVEALRRAKTELLSRRSSIEATLSILPARIALAEAQAAYQDFQQDLATIDEILDSGRDTLAASKPLLRTTSDLSDDNASTTSATGGFQAWLGETPTQ